MTSPTSDMMGRSPAFCTLSQRLSRIRTSKSFRGPIRHTGRLRALKVHLVEEVPLVDAEMLSDAESAALAESNPGTGFWSTCREDD